MSAHCSRLHHFYCRRPVIHGGSFIRLKPKTVKRPGGRRTEAEEPADAAYAADPAQGAVTARRSAGAPFPIAGIGASAGGLAAFEAFFSGMPSPNEPGVAFVLVQHLAPDHESMLSDLIRRYTRMCVLLVEDGMVVQPNCVYIIPPNRDMALVNGRLSLLEPGAPRGQRLPIDFFLRSLAQDSREHAIAVILSGTGSDGTQGVRAIKGEGGMVMVQDPASTEFDGMPRSAIETGLVDYQLAPAAMPAQLIGYVARAFGRSADGSSAADFGSESALRKIFALLRSHTSHDFSRYKLSTVTRRIARRMALHQIENIDDYLRFLRQSPVEIDAMFRDLLIGVTSFFRDPDAFKVLEEQVIPKLFDGLPPAAALRVWSAGCSTGEEVYSLAILLKERMDFLKQTYKIQIFATDIDDHAIASARAGVYPPSIAADVSPGRLARFFTREAGTQNYRIVKNVRDMLVFSTQDLIKDPPFSKLSLLVCRNLLIYFGAELQRKLIPLFHFALEPGGILFLGNSETVGEFDDLFAVLDRKSKLYTRSRQEGPRSSRSMPSPDALYARKDPQLRHPPDKTTAAVKTSLRQITEASLLKLLEPAAVLVNRQGTILYVQGRVGKYLEMATGEAGISNVLKMAREGLRLELTAALHRATLEKKPVHRAGLLIRTNGGFICVDLRVQAVPPDPAAGGETELYLVVFADTTDDHTQPMDAARAESGATALRDAEVDERIVKLREELVARDEYLQSINEELETSNEELKSSNEELQSVNEELQSTNEELETSKEELQSLNEELATVNNELQTKVADLSRANNDMNNLLGGTGIGTLFVDHDLCILRFTPAVTGILNLIGSDIGRPVTHIVSNLVGYDRIASDLRSVLDTLVPRELDVQSHTGEWYSMRILPYRTLDNVTEGAVLTFVNVTATKEALRNDETLFRQISELLPPLIWTNRPTGLIDHVSSGWTDITGLAEEQLKGTGWFDCLHASDRKDFMHAWDAARSQGADFAADARIRGRDGSYGRYRIRARALRNADGQVFKWIASGEEIPSTARKRSGRKTSEESHENK
jgi:two-component system CheB/CheR fusion protein